ncbi:PREDICTED: probable RNA methyltransferase CG11342 [Polistes canadensis]|uniref:probable RNA methyltransferase CG11342 n=1 Tax=Polistes canadensis TaxID=91411 RepID=UPI000718EBF1|nr:PREDICTED: probable RNA methyltransferase CG11342 [Polistes canadensis]
MSEDPKEKEKTENMKIKADPGASRYGNFMNYYQFHSAEERVRQLPRDVWQSVRSDRKYVGLDIGCNAGELTYKLYDFFNVNLTNCEEERPDIFLLGIDLDPILIERSQQSNPRPDRITFEYGEFLSSECDPTISRYLRKLGRTHFDVVFCFSISMWIHLNHGDEGLVNFFRKACSICDTIVVEPQPWKCYRNASRRLRLANLEDFPLIKKLERKGDMSEQIELILTNLCNFRKVIVTFSNDWQRKIMIFAKNNDHRSH